MLKDTPEKIYFKVKQTTAYNEVVESDYFIISKTEDGYKMTFEDTDSDGLPDVYEKELGTDPKKPDTDSDGLTDYQEIYLTGTDPLKIDTDGNKINDGDEDPDKDGLSILAEIKLGTEPLTADTDNDGLNDGDEVNKYKTDPLKFDTDGDSISDGDEVKIGLNPLNPGTNGVPDNQYTIEQTINADSKALSGINTEENPYKLSVDIKAAGCVENNITAKESSYSNAMKNDAILGVCPELIYNSDCKIDSVELKFNIGKEYISNDGSEYAASNPEFVGIKRYNIFRYFDDINMLLPVETKFDIANNLLYTDVDQLGTYCVMDMEKWLKGLGINPDGSQTTDNVQANATNNSLSGKPLQEESIQKSENTVTINNDFKGNSTASTNALDYVKVYFIIDTRKNSFDEETFSKIKENVIKSAEAIFAYSKNAEVYLITEYAGMDGESYTVIKDSKGNEAFKSINDLKNMVKEITTVAPPTGITADNVNNKCVISDPMKYVAENNDNNDVKTYCFNIFNPDKAVFDSENGNKDIQSLKDKNIDVSVITDVDSLPELTEAEKNQGYAVNLYKQTGGIQEKSYVNYSDKVIKHIFGDGDLQNTYTILSSTKLEPIILKAPLEEGTDTDTDEDGLTDWNEVNTDLIFKLIDSRTLKINFRDLPTFGKIKEKYSGLFYVKEGLDRYFTNTDKQTEQLEGELYNVHVIPILSDPTRPDGDGDGLDDCLDNEKLDASVHNFLIYETEANDSNLKSVAFKNRPQDYKYAEQSELYICATLLKFSKNDFKLTEAERFDEWRSGRYITI